MIVICSLRMIHYNLYYQIGGEVVHLKHKWPLLNLLWFPASVRKFGNKEIKLSLMVFHAVVKNCKNGLRICLFCLNLNTLWVFMIKYALTLCLFTLFLFLLCWERGLGRYLLMKVISNLTLMDLVSMGLELGEA